MAVETVTGASPAWFCEWDEAPSKVLAHHWPHVPNHRDVTTINWEEMEPVDILTGGSPCQDLSTAGKRAGMTEGTRSNLWVNMREAIATLRPRLVVWENVQGALSAAATSDSDMEPGTRLLGNPGGGHLRALGRVLGDLTEIGYDTEWTTLRASDIGAPHHRARIFLIAWPRHAHPQRDDGGQGPLLDRGRAQAQRPTTTSRPEHRSSAPTNPERVGRHGRGTAPQQTSGTQPTTDRLRPGNSSVEWGRYAPAIRRWERVLGVAAPNPTEPNSKGNPRLAAPFAEWMMGLPTGWVTNPEIGLTRAQQLKALGNGVCVQQATTALTHLLERR